MSTTFVPRIPLIVILLLILCGCPPPPPTINNFTVVPTNQCATVPVSVTWGASADEGQLEITPPTGETPPNPLPGLAGGGFLFATAGTDTTYRLTAYRGGRSVSLARTVTIVPNPFVTTLELPFNCTERVWELPAFSSLVYGDPITVENFVNLERQALVLEFGGQITTLPPGEPTRLLLPIRFTGSSWRARLNDGLSPECRGPGTTNPGDPFTPPPVRITVTSNCPR